MADVFSREVEFGGVFAADRATLQILPELAGLATDGQNDLAGFLIQNLSINYAQNVGKLFEVGGNKIYYVGGRPQGAATINRIVGARAYNSAFIQKYGDLCKMTSNGNNIVFDVGGVGQRECAGQDGAKIKFTAKFCLITNLSLAVQAADMMISEALQLMIGSLEYKT